MIEPYVQWFEDFASGFKQQETEAGVSHLELKRVHSHRVMDFAEAIAAAELGDPHERFLAQLAGLFHDVGRFPQYATYRTFKDSDSANHGHLGSATLRRAGVLDTLAPTDRRTVLGVVHMHNRRLLPLHLASRLRRLTELVRDADKLDIVRVMLGHFGGTDTDEVVVLHVEEHPTRYSPEVLAAAQQRQSPDYGAMRYVNDFKILLLHWAYELNFAASRRLFLERGYVADLLAHLPDHASIRRLGADITAHLNR